MKEYLVKIGLQLLLIIIVTFINKLIRFNHWLILVANYF